MDGLGHKGSLLQAAFAGTCFSCFDSSWCKAVLTAVKVELGLLLLWVALLDLWRVLCEEPGDLFMVHRPGLQGSCRTDENVVSHNRCPAQGWH